MHPTSLKSLNCNHKKENKNFSNLTQDIIIIKIFCQLMVDSKNSLLKWTFHMYGLSGEEGNPHNFTLAR